MKVMESGPIFGYVLRIKGLRLYGKPSLDMREGFGSWMGTHLGIWDRNSMGILTISIPGELDIGHRCIIELNIGHIFSSWGPPEALIG